MIINGMREAVLKELKAFGVLLMLLGALLEFSLPLRYMLDGLYHALPEQNLILTILIVITVIITWKGYSIAGGIVGIIIGEWVLTTGEFFPLRRAVAEIVIIGAIISIIAKCIELYLFKGNGAAKLAN